MNKLINKALRQFSKDYKGCEVRAISVAEGFGKAGKWQELSFCITYVDIKQNNINGEGYAQTYIRVSKD